MSIGACEDPNVRPVLFAGQACQRAQMPRKNHESISTVLTIGARPPPPGENTKGGEGGASMSHARELMNKLKGNFPAASYLLMATAKGVERDPGHTQNRRTPSRTSSSTTIAPHKQFRFGRLRRDATGLGGKSDKKFFI